MVDKKRIDKENKKKVASTTIVVLILAFIIVLIAFSFGKKEQTKVEETSASPQEQTEVKKAPVEETPISPPQEKETVEEIPSTPQEGESIIREIKIVDSPIKRNIVFYIVNLKSDDPINTAKEKAVIYRMVRGKSFREIALTMDCVTGASKCDQTQEQNYRVSVPGAYLIQLERSSLEKGEYIKEIIRKKEVYIWE